MQIKERYKWVRYILEGSKVYWALQVKIRVCGLYLERIKKLLELSSSNLPDLKLSKITADMEKAATVGVEIEEKIKGAQLETLKSKQIQHGYCFRGNT